MSSESSTSDTGGSRTALVEATLLGALVVALYARTLHSGFLSDDFLYLTWAREGFSTLLAKLTTQSYPRTLRPLLAPLWWLTAATETALVIRAIALLVHGFNAWLVCRLVRNAVGNRPVGLLAGALFAAFPLAIEAVGWPSGAFDVVACSIALCSLWILAPARVPPTEDRARSSPQNAWLAWLAIGLYALGLFAREGILFLPVIAILLFGRAVLRPAIKMAWAGAGYLLLRLVFFGGPGGYLGPSGGSLLSLQTLPATLLRFGRTVLLQIPHHLLVPLKDPGNIHLPILLVSLLLLGALAWRTRFETPLLSLVSAGGATFFALLPVMPILGVESHHEGSRLLYFPAAIALVFLGRATRNLSGIGSIAAPALVALWSIATIVNTGSWIEAGKIVRNTLQAMAHTEPWLPHGAEVLVDTPGTFLGAYVFRNGLPDAARLSGLRRDLLWQRGTSAIVGPTASSRLGKDLFVIEPTEDGHVIDRTPCEATLYQSGSSRDENVPPVDLDVHSSRGGATLTTDPQMIDQPSLFVRLRPAPCPGASRMSATLYWRDPSDGPFTVGRSRRALLDPSLPDAGLPDATPVRLPVLSGMDRVELRLDLDHALPPACVTTVQLVPLPRVCTVVVAERAETRDATAPPSPTSALVAAQPGERFDCGACREGGSVRGADGRVHDGLRAAETARRGRQRGASCPLNRLSSRAVPSPTLPPDTLPPNPPPQPTSGKVPLWAPTVNRRSARASG